MCAHTQYPCYARLIFSPGASLSYCRLGNRININLMWKDLQQNNGKREKWGCGTLPNPYWGKQFEFQRHLTSVASLKRGGGGGKRGKKNRSIEMQRREFLFLSSILLPAWHTPAWHTPFLWEQNFCVLWPRIQPLLGQRWKWPRKSASETLEESSCQNRLVKANRRGARWNINTWVFTFQNSVQMRYCVVGTYLCTDS